jgi:hypothetical protein
VAAGRVVYQRTPAPYVHPLSPHRARLRP